MSLFEDTFKVIQINPPPDLKKFDRVSRVVAHGENYEMDLNVDIATHIYKVAPGDKFSLVLAKTLNLDGTAVTKNWVPSDEPSLADNYEYVMCGLVFKVDLKKGGNELEVFASYGGLMMSLKGDARRLKDVKLDQQIFLLLRRIID